VARPRDEVVPCQPLHHATAEPALPAPRAVGVVHRRILSPPRGAAGEAVPAKAGSRKKTRPGRPGRPRPPQTVPRPPFSTARRGARTCLAGPP
jgi:hypothetical protein